MVDSHVGSITLNSMLHKNIILVVNSHIYAFTHLHLMTVKSMSQINHYQDESDYALKRIDGKSKTHYESTYQFCSQ